MTKAVIDNNIWLYYLLTNDQSIRKVMRLAVGRRLELFSSPEILEELNLRTKELLETRYLSKTKIIAFMQLVPSLFRTYKKKPLSHSLEDKKLSIYADLATSEKIDYLVAYNYKELERLDGFEGINVVGLETFLKNLF
ncbi:MAG: putative toxin-antitoxin system toxin component, PIN family [Candidatus Dojkabacteria bacterium]|jgi:putative PIN family toxin of toxin-antitoxin system|nr:putative toxin-antitoxin system toxin component, PIN family [Candidatus Dojkabacteria bacterium]